MTTQLIQRLQYLCDSIPQLLNEIDDHIFSIKPVVSGVKKKSSDILLTVLRLIISVL